MEFEIVVSCYGPGIEYRLHDLSQLLASDELEMLAASLRKLQAIDHGVSTVEARIANDRAPVIGI